MLFLARPVSLPRRAKKSSHRLVTRYNADKTGWNQQQSIGFDRAYGKLHLDKDLANEMLCYSLGDPFSLSFASDVLQWTH